PWRRRPKPSPTSSSSRSGGATRRPLDMASDFPILGGSRGAPRDARPVGGRNRGGSPPRPPAQNADDTESGVDNQGQVRYYSGPELGAGWSSLVARRAHNPEVVGSNPTPATDSDSIRARRLERRGMQLRR